MLQEIIQLLKKGVWVIICLAGFKIYENNGFLNPITLSVLVIATGFWALIKLELNEEVDVPELTPNNQNIPNLNYREFREREYEPNNTAPPTTKFCNTLNCECNKHTTSNSERLNMDESNFLNNNIERRIRRTETKLRQLARSRSVSATKKDK